MIFQTIISSISSPESLPEEEHSIMCSNLEIGWDIPYFRRYAFDSRSNGITPLSISI